MQENSTAHSLVFKGNGFEYAKIYFVNLALTILTLGIYSAWAKVRNKRYFYGNTSIDGSSFDYHALPIQILKGRLLIVAGFFVYMIATQVAPITAPFFVLAFFVLVPWAILRSVQFNLQNTSYRQVRFGFDGKLSNMFSYYILLPIASAFTLFLLYPFAVFQQKYYLANKSRFGQTSFKFDGKSKEFYMAYLTVIGVGILLLVGTFVLIGTAAHAADTNQNQTAVAAAIATMVVVYAFFVFGALLASTYINTRITNYVYSNLSLNEIKFKAAIGFWRLLWIYLVNAVLIMLTLGIYIPWAKVRVARYKLSCITIYGDDLGGYIAAEASNTKAVGEEFSDVMDIDVGI